MSRGLINNLPIFVYSCMLLVVWLYSWIRSVVALFLGVPTERLLASADGVRYFLRSSVDSVGHLPWAVIIILLMCSGLIYSCGILPAIGRLLRGETSMRMRRAFWASLVAAVIVGILLLFATLYPLDVFRSVSGGYVSSPMAGGWPLVLLGVCFLPFAVFGVVSGSFRGVDDVVEALSSRIRFHAASLVSLVLGALLLASMEYEAMVVELFGRCSSCFEYFVIVFPFAFKLLYNRKK